MTSPDRSVTAKLKLDTKDYDRPAQQSKKVTEELGDAARKTRDKSRAAWDDIAHGATLAGAALTASVGALILSGARFEQQMSKVDAVTEASAAQMDQLRQAAIQAGKDTVFSATEAAKAEEELAKAGIGTADILGGALRGSLDLASAGSLDLAEAADVAAKTMNIFKLAGKDVGHIADVLAAAANKSATDVHELGMAMKMGGLAASAAGLSLEETVGTLAAFADRALVGSDAGTSLKTALMMLQAPSDKAAALMKELGINAYDANGQFVGTAKLAGILRTALGGLTQEQRNAALATIFGADAMRAANVLFEVGEQGIRDYIAAVDDQGAATDTAAKKTDNLMGDIERLTGSIESLAIESSNSANGGLRALVQMADALVTSIGSMPPIVGNAVVVLSGVAGVSLLAAAGFLKARGVMRDVNDALGEMGPRGERAARGLQVATRWAGRATAAFVALEVINAVAGAFADAAPDVERLAASIQDLAAAGKAAEQTELTRLFGKNLGQIKDDLKFISNLGGLPGALKGAQFEPGFMRVFDGSVQSTVDRVKGLDAALAQLATGGNGKAAEQFFARLRAEAQHLGISEQKLLEMFPQYTFAAKEAAKATDPVAKAQQDAARTAAVLTGSWADAVREGKSLVDVFNDLNGTAIDWAEAEIGIEGAFDDLTETIKENEKTLDLDTEAGRDNMQAIIDTTREVRDGMQARFEHIKATQGEAAAIADAAARHATYRQRLIDALVPLVGSRQEAEKLADTYLKMPKQVATTATLTVAPPLIGPPSPASIQRAAAVAAQELQRELNRYLLSVPVTSSTGSGRVRAERWGGVYEHAQIGLLREAAVFSARSPARFAFAEPATGGEAFIPKNGDPGRSVPILQRAASWYGQRVMPANGGNGFSVAALAAAVAAAAGASNGRKAGFDEVALGRALRSALRGVSVRLDGRAVGEIEARRADLYSRGG